MLLLLAGADGGLLARPVNVRADHLEVRNAEHRLDYTGHAHAVSGTTVVDCDQLTVFYGADQQVLTMDFKGAVAAQDGERQAWGEAAHFDNLTQVLEVTGQPRVKSGERQVQGEKVVFTQGSGKLEVVEPRTLARQASGEQVEIEAHHLTLLDKEQLATWTGEVKAKKGTVRLFAPELTARYDEHGEVKQLLGKGGVHVIDREREAWGEKLDDQVDAGVVVVTGHPRARDGHKRIQGSRVKFLTHEDRLVVDDAVSIFEGEGGGPRR